MSQLSCAFCHAYWVRRLLFSSLYLGFLLLWWVLSEWLAERIWWVTVLAYIPQHGLLLPAFALLVWTALRRDARASAVNMASVLLVLFAFMGLRINFPRASADQSIRVVSYNIRGASDAAKFMDASKADIICVQESRDLEGLYNRLKAQLPQYQSINTGELTLFSKHPILENKVTRVPQSNRVWSESVLEIRGQRVRIINVHFLTLNIQGRRATDSMEARVSRFSGYRWEITDAMLQSITTSLEPVVICGDFNTPPKGSLYRAFSSRLNDAFAVTGNGFGFSYRVDIPVLRIDYVFTNLSVLKAWIPDTRASDHRPMVTDLLLP